MFNWASSVPRFGSNIRNGSERLGWAINLGWTINLSWTINLVLIIRLWAILIFFCLSSFSTAQSTKLASQPARPSLISASLAPAAVVDHKVVGDKSKAVELKLPKAVIQALKKGTPDYGVKTEVLRAVKLKPYSKIGVSSRTLDNMANPSRTHQVDASKSPTIDETKSKPTALKNGANDDTIVARSIRIKSPGQQALDSVNIALPSISRASETGKGSKIFAPRRVGFDTKATSTALDSIQRKVQSVLPDTARPDVDSKITKQQDLNSINGINPAQAKPEATGGTAAVTPKVVVRPDSVEQKSSVAPNSIEQKTAVAPNSIEQKTAVAPNSVEQKSSVAPSSIEQKTAVAPNSVEQKAAVDPDSIEQKTAVAPNSIEQKAAVNPDNIKQKAAVNPDNIKQQAAVNPNSIEQKTAVAPNSVEQKAAVNPDNIKQQAVVNPDSIEQKTAVAPNSVEQKAAVDPDSIKQQAAVNPDSIKQQAAVNPDSIKQKAAVDPDSIKQKAALNPDSIKQQAAVNPDSIKQKAAVDPDSIKQQAAVNPDSIKQQAAVAPDSIEQKAAVDPDSIEQKAAVDPDSIEQKAAVDPDSIEEKAAVDPDSIEQKAAVDPDSIEQKAAVDPESIEQKAAVDTASIKKKAAVDTDSIKKKAAVDKSAIEAKGTVDLSANFKAINKAASGSISGAISGKASSSVSVTDDGIDSSTINTDSVSNALDKQAKQFGAKGDTDRNAADNVGVPAVTQDCVRKKRVLGFIGRKYCSKHAPNPASVAANSTALAKKKNLNERAKGNYNAANKIDKKRDDLIATQGGYSSEDALPASSSYGGVNTAVTGSQQDRSANQSDTQQHQKNTHNPYALNHDASKHRILELSGTRDFIIALGDINASIGLDSEAIQQIATVQGNVRGSPSFNVIPLTTRSDLVNASIGDKSLARQAIDQLGDNDRDTNVPNGAVTFSGETVGGVNASIGSDSKAYHLQSLVSGTFTGAKVFSMSDGFVNASIGSDTTSKLRLSVFQGQAPSGSLDLMSAAAGIVVAAIGHKSTANFSAASGENVTSVGNVKLHAVAPGAIVASIGSNTSATTLLASATGASASAMDVSVTGLLPSIAAAIGVNSEAHNTVAVLRENVEVGGEWQANIVYGQLTAFSLGNNTNAINEIGVISANVSGDIKQQIVVGAMLAGTLGSNTESTNKVGNVEARVNGNVTTNINILDVNTLSLGLTSGVDRKIYARTSIGNVFPNSSGSAYGTIKKDITITGPIINLGIGLIIDLGFLGVLDLSAPGCVNIGNNGTNPC